MYAEAPAPSAVSVNIRRAHSVAHRTAHIIPSQNGPHRKEKIPQQIQIKTMARNTTPRARKRRSTKGCNNRTRRRENEAVAKRARLSDESSSPSSSPEQETTTTTTTTNHNNDLQVMIDSRRALERTSSERNSNRRNSRSHRREQEANEQRARLSDESLSPALLQEEELPTTNENDIPETIDVVAGNESHDDNETSYNGK
jgi:hypothetical protein